MPAYEGSISQWIDANHGTQRSIDDLVLLAKAQGKDYTRKQIRQQRVVALKYLKTPRKRGPGVLVDVQSKPQRKASSRPQNGHTPATVVAPASTAAAALAARQAAILATEVHPDDDGPPPKHTALRRLILDVGLDAAMSILEEFRLISERMR